MWQKQGRTKWGVQVKSLPGHTGLGGRRYSGRLRGRCPAQRRSTIICQRSGQPATLWPNSSVLENSAGATSPWGATLGPPWGSTPYSSIGQVGMVPFERGQRSQFGFISQLKRTHTATVRRRDSAGLFLSTYSSTRLHRGRVCSCTQHRQGGPFSSPHIQG